MSLIVPDHVKKEKTIDVSLQFPLLEERQDYAAWYAENKEFADGLRVTHNQLLIEPLPTENKSSGGIIIDSSKALTGTGVIRKLDAAGWPSSGSWVPQPYKVGDVVLLNRPTPRSPMVGRAFKIRGFSFWMTIFDHAFMVIGHEEQPEA